MQQPISFGIIGGGWRSTFFLQIARALPERFRVAAIAVRDAEKGTAEQNDLWLEMTPFERSLLPHDTSSSRLFSQL